MLGQLWLDFSRGTMPGRQPLAPPSTISSDHNLHSRSFQEPGPPLVVSANPSFSYDNRGRVIRITSDGDEVSVLYVPNPRARRYIMRLRSDRTLLVTIPRRGTFQAASEFVKHRTTWIRRQLSVLRANAVVPGDWSEGKLVWFRGERLTLRWSDETENRTLLLGPHRLPIASSSGNLRPLVEGWMFQVAKLELPQRTMELAEKHQVSVKAIAIRNLRSRWGSCSSRGHISLNWRLIQMPRAVSDYVMLHELMHLRQMNHSAAFWAQVAAVCPDYRQQEHWLKTHAAQLGL